MSPFLSARAAKDFLVSQIARQAALEHVPLSEVERKMLYYTESYESLPDIAAVAEQFDAEYDSAEYESKISRLIANAIDRLKRESPSERDTWDDAVKYLRKEDHYILVMIHEMADPTIENDSAVVPRPDWRDQWKLLGAGIATAAVLVTVIFAIGSWGNDIDWKPEWFRSVSDDTWGKLLVGGILLTVVANFLMSRREQQMLGKGKRQPRND
jgi:hypothetical protein